MSKSESSSNLFSTRKDDTQTYRRENAFVYRIRQPARRLAEARDEHGRINTLRGEGERLKHLQMSGWD